MEIGKFRKELFETDYRGYLARQVRLEIIPVLPQVATFQVVVP
jgi:hypothetical protein